MWRGERREDEEGRENGYRRNRSRSPPSSSGSYRPKRDHSRDRSRERSMGRDRSRSREKSRDRSIDRDRKRYRSRSPPALKDHQKKYRQMNEERGNGRHDGHGERGGRGRGGGGRRGGRGHDDNEHRNFVDLRVDGLKKKTKEVNFQVDAEVGEPEQPLEKEEDVVLTEDKMKEIEEFLLNEEETEEEREQRLIEERRKRREEILKKHASESRPQETTPAMQPSEESKVATEVKDDDDDEKMTQAFPLPIRDVDIEKEAAALMAEREAVEAEAKREATISFDIFSASPTSNTIPMKKGDTLGKRAMRDALLEGEDPLLQSNWDDGEGYYKTRIGEVICDRYRTMGEIGKGVFSTVLKCLDLRRYEPEDSDTHAQVVLKVIRNNDIMRKASEKELQLLSLISRHDPDGKKHCVRMISHADYRNHIVIVFEPLSMNLRETLKKFGKNVGINITAVRMYARQLFVALRHLSDLRIVHADIKPDNIVVSEDLKTVKLCDFGSAFLETDSGNDPTPYLVSRFYRAPEIILALPYDRNIDLWSVGVCLYELFTGHVMFPGRTNNEMLKLMMEIKGKVPNKLIKSSIRQYESMGIDPHFDLDMKFKLIELDPVTGKPLMRLVDIIGPSKDLSSILLSSKAGADDRSLVAKLTDLLEKCLTIDPAKRIKVSEALKHSLFHSNHVPVPVTSKGN